jgi:hypothetical protein
MFDIRIEFSQELSTGKRLVLMPVSRFKIEKPFRIDHFAFFPAGSIELSALRTVPGQLLATTGTGTIESLQGQQLREVLSNLTGASPEVLGTHAIVAFPYDIDWEEFLNADHRYDIDLLRRLSEYADQAMDTIKLHYCTLSAPYAIPGGAGTWDESGEYLCALLYDLHDNESYLIAGRGVVSRIVAGLGLELDAERCSNAMSLPVSGEVGNIVCHGLRLYS